MWQNKRKAVTFSFDDGVMQDIRMIELLDRYGLKATFNLNSERLGEIQEEVFNNKTFIKRKIKPDEVKQVYQGHEVAAHTLTHLNLTKIAVDSEIVRQVKEDKINLQKYSGQQIIGMAYPCGGVNNDERVAKIIKDHTGIRYARTINSTNCFDLQDNLLRFNPTAHFLADNIFELAKKFLTCQSDSPQLLYIWGHTYECDYWERWDKTEELFRQLSGHDDIYYATNREIFGV